MQLSERCRILVPDQQGFGPTRGYRKAWTQQAAIWVAATFLLLVSLASASAGPKRVLFLHSFGPNFSPYSDFVAKLREDLARQTSEGIDLYEVSVASARFAEDEQEGPLVAYVNSLFVGRPPDLLTRRSKDF
jgi:hypothetical protein